MKDTTMRYLATLTMIPREPSITDACIITEKLNEQGYDVTIRTVQRDLVKLSAKFPLVRTKNIDSNAFLWSWSESSAMLDIPKMSPLTALTFTLVESYLRHLLPKPILGFLNHHFDRAKALLDKLQSTHYFKWHEKFRIIQWGPDYIPPKISENVIDVVYNAILNEKQFTGNYKTKTGKVLKKITVNPLGIAFRRENNYLICTYLGAVEVRHLLLHRFQKVVPSDQQREIPNGFNIDDYISSGAFSYQINKKPIKLHALFAEESMIYREEAPISNDQTLSKQIDGRVLLKATVHDSFELRWWLTGFGDKVEVMKPKYLREAFMTQVKNLASMYKLM
jgi:predicted DNA-binding transcriptional regulator YafY